MNNQEKYILNRARAGWAMLALGGVLFAAGLAMQHLFILPVNPRIVSGLGIALAGAGLAQALRYRAAAGDRKIAARVANEERDERAVQIRTRAGNRAFWVSLALTYIALMWLSFASNGSLPEPSADALWFYLAGAVVIPLVVYIAGIMLGERNS